MWRAREIISIEQSLERISLKDPILMFVQKRYIFLLLEYNLRARQYSITYHCLRGFISIGSLIVPALLSVQYTNGVEQIATQLYWIVWGLSLLVTISNGIMQLVKIDKKYFTLNTIYHQLVSEGWQFIQLTGKYSGPFTPGIPPTHENQYLFFTSSIEKIRMKQVEEEYYKVIEQTNNQTEQLIPPTPSNPLFKTSGNNNTPFVSKIENSEPFPKSSSTTQNSLPQVNAQETAIQRKNPTQTQIQIQQQLSNQIQGQGVFFGTNPLTHQRTILANSLPPARS